MPRPLSELKVRATAHFDITDHLFFIDDEFIDDVARRKFSPSAAFSLTYKQTKCFACAKAIRWLAVIARDYGRRVAKEVRDLL